MWLSGRPQSKSGGLPPSGNFLKTMRSGETVFQQKTPEQMSGQEGSIDRQASPPRTTTAKL